MGANTLVLGCINSWFGDHIWSWSFGPQDLGLSVHKILVLIAYAQNAHADVSKEAIGLYLVCFHAFSQRL